MEYHFQECILPYLQIQELQILPEQHLYCIEIKHPYHIPIVSLGNSSGNLVRGNDLGI